MQIKVNFLCRDSILAAPVALDVILFLDLARRAGSPGCRSGCPSISSLRCRAGPAAGARPVHTALKLTNTLRILVGEEVLYHSGLDYYEGDLSNPAADEAPIRRSGTE